MEAALLVHANVISGRHFPPLRHASQLDPLLSGQGDGLGDGACVARAADVSLSGQIAKTGFAAWGAIWRSAALGAAYDRQPYAPVDDRTGGYSHQGPLN